MAMLPIALVVLLAAPAALSSEPPTITAPSVTIDAAQIADVDDLVVTADPVTHTPTVEPPAPVSRPALPMVRDFFMPPVQAAWQITPPPPSQAPTPAPYRVRVGDDIRLAWYNLAPIDSEMSSTYRVETDGTIALKYVGAVRVVGKTTLEVQDAVLMALTPKIYREGVVSVVAAVTPSDDLAHAEVSAVNPGDTVTITVRETPALSGAWVLQADGSLRRQGAPTPVMPPAPPAPPQAPAKELVFFVNGEVIQPGQKKWAEGMTVEKALVLAVGMTSRGKLGHIMRPIRDDQGNVVKYEKILNLKPETEILPDDELVITRRWWGN